MNDDHFFYVGDSGASRSGTRSDAIEWLTSLYGDDPSKVGTIDGTEDDFGDLISADLPFAILGEHTFDDEDLIDRMTDALDGVERWSEALDVARTVLA
jgi:hypothetical protein